jgi:hypothetical protein
MVERGGPEGLVGRRKIDDIEDAKGTHRFRIWDPGLRVVPAGQSTTIDIAELRRTQATDAKGNTIPLAVVKEQDTGGGGPDTCWFPNSQAAKFEALTGHT